jgi:hypothetical protein
MPRTYILSYHPVAVESLGDTALRRSDHDAARKAYLRGRSKQIGAYATLRECPIEIQKLPSFSMTGATSDLAGISVSHTSRVTPSG